MPPSREGSERVINASVPSHPCVQNWIDEPPPAQHAQWLSLVLLRYGTSGTRDVVHRAPRRRVRSRRQRGSAPVPTAPTRPGQRLRAAASQLHQSLLSLVVTADGRDPPRTGTTIAPRRCTRQGAAPSRRSRRLRGRAPPSSGRPPPLDLATHQRHLSKRRPANSHCDPTASRYRPDQSPPPSDPWLPCISRNPIADRSAQSAGLGRVASNEA